MGYVHMWYSDDGGFGRAIICECDCFIISMDICMCADFLDGDFVWEPCDEVDY